MKGLVATIKSIFANEVAIHVSRERVTIAWDGQSLSICPVVHVAPGPGEPRIVGIGDASPQSERGVLVPIFGPLPAGMSLETWVAGLHAFMNYALLQASVRIVAVRPTVRLQGVHELGQVPSGEPCQVLMNAVLRAGAIHCTVES